MIFQNTGGIRLGDLLTVHLEKVNQALNLHPQPLRPQELSVKLDTAIQVALYGILSGYATLSSTHVLFSAPALYIAGACVTLLSFHASHLFGMRHATFCFAHQGAMIIKTVDLLCILGLALNPRTKIQDTHCFIFNHCTADFIFLGQKIQKKSPSKSEFFLEVGLYRWQFFQNFMMISDLEYIRKRALKER
jgi:hypothetical protein